MNAPQLNPASSRRAGFTLLEMLVVVFILAAVALSTVSITQDADSQFRYEDTRARRELVKRAVIGSPDLQVNGQPMLTGFVADMGRLPTSLRELVERGALPAFGSIALSAASPPPPLPTNMPTTWGLAVGWRGPYLSGTEENGVRVFRDGWGNVDPVGDAANYGWIFTDKDSAGTVDGTLKLQSLGSDLEPGSTPNQPYSEDYPASSATTPSWPPTLIDLVDYEADLTNASMRVNLLLTPPLPPTPPTSLRLRLYSLAEGAGAWTLRQTDSQDLTPVPVGGGPVSFTFLAGASARMGSTLAIVLDTSPTLPAPVVLNPGGNTSPLRLAIVPRASLTGVNLGTWTVN